MVPKPTLDRGKDIDRYLDARPRVTESVSSTETLDQSRKEE